MGAAATMLSYGSSSPKHLDEDKICDWEIPATYDFNKDSSENYRIPFGEEPQFVGKYGSIRRLLDYEFHSHYLPSRQIMQDDLIQHFLDTIIHDSVHNLVCEEPLENWIVFTAGAMGAGKGHTLEWLVENKIFPLESFVNVDPDKLRSILPEMKEYNRRDELTAGYHTQREVGYISETLTYDALLEGKNVLVDGSLRDSYWYKKYFQHLRLSFPKLKIAIIHITAPEKTVLERAAKRAKITGRVVPEDVIIDSLQKIPESLELLGPDANLLVTFENGDDVDPKIIYAASRNKNNSEKWDLNWTLTPSLDNNKNQYIQTMYGDTGIINNTLILNEWKPLFSEQWIMECALPSKSNKTRPVIDIRNEDAGEFKGYKTDDIIKCKKKVQVEVTIPK
eukprot:gene8310-11242_t